MQWPVSRYWSVLIVSLPCLACGLDTQASFPTSLADDRSSSSAVHVVYPIGASLSAHARPLTTFQDGTLAIARSGPHLAEDSIAVFSNAFYPASNGNIVTAVDVHVQNATEIRWWRLYKTTQYGQTTEAVASITYKSLNTSMEYVGYASYVFVEALDGDQEPMGRSQIIETIPPSNVKSPAVIREKLWIQNAAPQKPVPVFASNPSLDMQPADQDVADGPPVPLDNGAPASLWYNPRATFWYGVLSGGLLVIFWRRTHAGSLSRIWCSTSWTKHKVDLSLAVKAS